MKTLNLRDANQQFSKLVREIEATGEGVLVLRDGKPAIRMMPAADKPVPRKLSPEQEAALARLLDPKNRIMSPPGWKFDREAYWDEEASRHTVVRNLPAGKPQRKKRS
ncbi:MAG: type II toxin-antitoxin system Phd/YefM family antitoxin [Alphaproteobacteria bacterium]|nr:type II toxin-antitoxin system Phd/YefM family antitoxin [Alphaproteobacteria bacterium]MBV9693655.1 type II toxin-antitoxin system Phd/YefM family antitoxin [Alphaproteobacteria bacterium]